jgi:hypothetical protein
MNREALEFIEKRIQHYLDNFDGNCSPLTELYCYCFRKYRRTN